MDILRSIWSFLTGVLSSPIWGDLAIQVAIGVVQFLVYAIAVLRPRKDKKLQFPTWLEPYLHLLRRIAQLRRWGRAERNYLAWLKETELMRLVKIPAKSRPVDVARLYTPQRLVWYQPAAVKALDAVPYPTEGFMLENDALAESDRLVILGETGAGKTSLVKHLAREMAAGNSEWTSYLRRRFAPGDRCPLPVYLNLGQLERGKGSVLANLAELTSLPAFFHTEAAEYLREQLERGRCLVILDSLDEVSLEARPDVLTRLNDFQQQLTAPNQIVLTSRLASYHQELPVFSELEIIPFNSHQIHRFIQNWFDPHLEEADKLEQILDGNQRLAELATTPLLLAIIALVHELSQKDPHFKLPDRRVALYDLCASALLTKWAEVSRRPYRYIYTEAQKRQVLESLAYWFHLDGLYFFPEEELRKRLAGILDDAGIRASNLDSFWREIYEECGIFHEVASGTYSLIQSAFQEYFVACYLHKHPPGAEALKRYLTDPRWRDRWQEPIILLAGLRNDATELVEPLLDQPAEVSQLLLAVRLLRDAMKTPESTKRRVLGPLLDWLLRQDDFRQKAYQTHLQDLGALLEGEDWERLLGSLHDPLPAARARQAEVLGCLRHPRAVQPLIGLLEDPDRGVRSAAVAALHQIGRPAVLPLIDVLKRPDHSLQRQGAAEALGRTGDPRALQPLLNALQDTDDEVSQVAAHSLGRMGYMAVGPLMDIVNSQPAPRGEAAAVALGMIGGPAVEPLVQALDRENPAVRRVAIAALCRMVGTNLDAMLGCIEDKRVLVREGLARVVGICGDVRAVAPLIKALADKADVVRQAATGALADLGKMAVPQLIDSLGTSRHANQRMGAAIALGRIGDREAIPVLIKATDDRDWSVRLASVIALGQWKETESVPALIARLNDRKPAVREAAARSLGRVGCKQAVPALARPLRDGRWQVRAAAAESLGVLQEPAAADLLLPRLRERAWQVRQAVIHALGILQDPRAIPLLVKALGDEQVYEAAMVALTSLGPAAVNALLGALGDRRTAVVVRAIRVLAQVSDRDALGALTGLTGHQDRQVSMAAIEALGQSGFAEAVDPLVKLLTERYTDDETRRAAADALGKLAQPQAVEALARALSPLENPNWLVRRSIAIALGAIKHPSAVDALAARIEHDEAPGVRSEATTALGKIGGPQAEQILRNACNSRHLEVREAAARAIGNLQTT